MVDHDATSGAGPEPSSNQPAHRILFVDDEPNILLALRRMTRPWRARWACHFAEGGAAALEILDRHPIDAVISDMRMPGMDGAELLDRVRAVRPQAVRIILSGHAKEDSILRVIGPAHHYLAKPCDHTVLQATIERALNLRAALTQPDLLDLIGQLDTLPSLDERHQRLLRELDSPSASTGSIAALVDEDVAMTTDLLRITNSQYFAVLGEVTTAAQAVRLLGLETIRLLAVKAVLFRQFTGPPELVAVLQALDRRAVEMAALTRQDAMADGLSGHRLDNAVCAGMLWEVGLLPLLARWPDRLSPVIARVRDGAPLGATFRDHIGASPGAVGGYLLGLWGFSDEVVEAVMGLDDPTASADRPDSLLPILRRAREKVTVPL